MTEEEIKKALDCLTNSERIGFETKLQERLKISEFYRRVEEIEKGNKVFEFSLTEHTGKLVFIRSYQKEGHVYTIVYFECEPKEIFCLT